MSRSHDRLTHTIRQLKTSLRTGATPVVPMRATESGKCQTSIRKGVNQMGCWTNGLSNRWAVGINGTYPMYRYMEGWLICLCPAETLFSEDKNNYCILDNLRKYASSKQGDPRLSVNRNIGERGCVIHKVPSLP